MHYENWTGWMGLHMWIWIVLLVVLAIVFIRLAMPGNKEDISPRQILDQRYAKGEISKDQYERMRRDLNN